MFREEKNCRSSGRNGTRGYGFDPWVASKIFFQTWARQVSGVIIKTAHPILFVQLIVVIKRIIYGTPMRKSVKYCNMLSLGRKRRHSFFTLKIVDYSKILFSLIFQMRTIVEKNTRNVADSGGVL